MLREKIKESEVFRSNKMVSIPLITGLSILMEILILEPWYSGTHTRLVNTKS